jgi:hypothetical protein
VIDASLPSVLLGYTMVPLLAEEIRARDSSKRFVKNEILRWNQGYGSPELALMELARLQHAAGRHLIALPTD